jgi:L-serine dehydratase
LKEKLQADEIHLLRGENTQFVEVKSQEFFAPNTASELCATFDISSIKHIGPVVPVLSRRGMDVPFITGEEMMEYNQDKGLDLWELAVHYECARGAITDKEVMETMIAIIDIMENAIHIGLAGTEYADRILGYQSGTFQDHMENRRLIEGGVLSQIIMYTTALMESKSAMGLIVAAPTAGACGGLPGAVIGAASAMGLSKEEMTQAMLAGGMIGVFMRLSPQRLADARPNVGLDQGWLLPHWLRWQVGQPNRRSMRPQWHSRTPLV